MASETQKILDYKPPVIDKDPMTAARVAMQNVAFHEQNIKNAPVRLEKSLAKENTQAFYDAGRELGQGSQYRGGPSGGSVPNMQDAQRSAMIVSQDAGRRAQQAATVSDAYAQRDADLMALDQYAMSLPSPAELQETAIANVINEANELLASDVGTDTDRFVAAQSALLAHKQFPAASMEGAKLIAGSILGKAKEVNLSPEIYLGRMKDAGFNLTDRDLIAALFALGVNLGSVFPNLSPSYPSSNIGTSINAPSVPA